MSAAALALAACQTTTQTAATSSEAAPTVAFMTQAELLATPGETLFGIASSDSTSEWVQTYSDGGKSGTIAGTWNGDPYDAEWSVEGNRWCEKWDTGEACYLVLQEAEKQFRFYDSASEPRENPAYMR